MMARDNVPVPDQAERVDALRRELSDMVAKTKDVQQSRDRLMLAMAHGLAVLLEAGGKHGTADFLMGVRGDFEHKGGYGA